MSNLLMNALIGAGIAAVIGYVLITRVENSDRRRARAGGGADNSSDSYSGTSDGFSLGSWFSSDSSGSSSDSGNCSSSDSSGGGDCGGGGDSGGGGGGD
ncbi:hypothetical protein [Bradyrhizobium neotropicale]|uniref:Uncharacterized protein n=1 Tax=Bradyrhizobium neotropicale TaxID=1497615 RepID=A0A176ZE92_9BRAD|nr:hypothetical protein [Bradyrhizobium neotropicale]OAF18163.1 hypothetical protein AXW67_06595 [Bradyrhizobium neotropicale]